MFNSGFRGKRAGDNQGTVNTQTQFVQNLYPLPTITSWSISGTDDTALNPAGGQTVLVNGTGFATGVAATLNGSTISPVTLVNPTQISFTSPALAGGSYTLIVYNSSGGAAILVPGLTYSSVPTYTTAAGSIGTAYETNSISANVVATSDSAITYSLASGSLPSGATLYANGVITGTAPADSGSTTYTFGITATDAELQDVTRTFTLTINTDVVTWNSPANASVTTSYEYASISNVSLSATSAAGKSIVYTGNSFPTGISVSGNTISGAANTIANTAVLLTATANASNRTATRTVFFDVQQDVVTWTNPSSNTSITISGSYSNTLSATSAAGFGITYTANSLPTGLSLNTATISGTPTVQGTSTTLLTATAATTNRSAQRTITWTVQLNDAYFKNVSLLLSGSTTNTSFINDSSLNNTQLTINGATAPVPFSPYYGDGYYSVNFPGSTSLSTASIANLSIGTNNFTIELWAMPQVISDALCVFITSNNSAMSAPVGFLLRLSSTTGWQLIVGNGSSDIYNTTASFATYGGGIGVWTHHAIVRSSGTLRWYVNGVQAYTVSDSTAFNQTYLAFGNYASYYWNGYISNFRIVNGTGIYTSNFTPPTTPLTAIANTSVLVLQSNRLIDKSTNAISLTSAGTPTVSSAIPFTSSSSYSTYGSALFPTDTGADNLRLPASLPWLTFTADFTLEFWVYVTGAEVRQYFGTLTNGKFRLYTNAGGLQLYNNTGTINITASGAFPNSLMNQWVHIAISRTGSNLYYFVNGISKTLTYSAGSSTDTIDFDDQPYIGTYSGSKGFQGYMADFRVVKGTGVYTTNFTPPTSPLTAITNTKLLICQYNGGANNNGIIDNGLFNNVITRYGNASQGSYSPYSVTGWSNYFNGSAGALTSANSTNNSLGSGDYTIEFWCYSNSLGSGSAGCMFYGDMSGYQQLLRHNGSYWECYYKSGVGFSNVSTSTVGINQWVHHALVRYSGTVKWYINGVQYGSASDSTNFSSSTFFQLGTYAGYVYDGYVSNVRVVKGTAIYTSAFTPSTTPLTAVTGTVFLTAQSNRFVDNGPNNNTLTITSTPSVQAYSPFGSIPEAVPISYSNYFDGTGDYLTVPDNAVLQMGSGDFTIEFWINYSSIAGYQTLYSKGYTAAGDILFQTGNGNGVLIVYLSGSAVITESTGAIIGTWYHYALVRSGTAVTLYRDGISRGTATSSVNFNTTNQLGIGAAGKAPGGGAIGDFPMNGYISNLRIIKGTAVYTSAFTPPTSPLTAISGTSLLTCQSTRMIDNSTNNFTLTANGDTKPRIFNPFGYTAQTNTSYTPSIHGGSVYLDGIYDYVTIPNNSNLLFGSSNFTIECWWYVNARSSSGSCIGGMWPATNRQWIVVYETSITKLRFLYTTDGSTAIEIGATYTMNLNTWYHVAFVRNGNTFTIYVNGISVTTGSMSGVTLYSSTAPLYVGVNPQDMAAPLNNWSTNGYITDFRIIKGYAAYTSNFVPPAQPLTNYSTNIPSSLLLNFNNAGIVDQHSSNVLETVGNTQLAPQDPYSGSYYSTYFDGTGDYLTIASTSALGIASSNFTIELWAYFTGATDTNDQPFIVNITSSGFLANTFWFGKHSVNSGKVTVYIYNYSSSTYFLTESTLPPANTWTHYALVRSGNTFTIYRNGISSVSGTFAGALTSATSPAWIGRSGDGLDANSFKGYISNFRIVNGTAVYTSNFTPPTSPLTAIANTSLLTGQSNQFKDNSTNALAITRNGDVAVKSFNPFQQNTGKSMYFDGTGDYLYSSPSINYAMNSGDFTIEFWYYPITHTNANPTIISTWYTTWATNKWALFAPHQNNANKYSFWVYNYSLAVAMLVSTSNVTDGAWVHIAISRSGSTWKLFINGTSEASVTSSVALDAGTAASMDGLWIGANFYSADSGRYINAYVNDLRITKGYARYTSNFTPPTSPFSTK